MGDKRITNSGSSPDANYEIGHKKPPVDTRFKLGISGNPKERPKKKANNLKKPRVYAAKVKPEEKSNDPPPLLLRELTQQGLSKEVGKLSLDELRLRWTKAWDIKPHRYIRRPMLEASLKPSHRFSLNPMKFRDTAKRPSGDIRLK
jgi:hypothetical protein